MLRRHTLPISVLALSVVGVAVAQNFSATRPAAEGVTTEQLTKAAVIPMRLSGQTLATDLIGATAYSRSGGELGRVKDLLFDETGKLAGMVVSVGGFLGVGGKEIAVPYNLADVVKGDDGSTTGVRIELSKRQIESAPEFKAVSDKSGPAAGDAGRAALDTRRM